MKYRAICALLLVSSLLFAQSGDYVWFHTDLFPYIIVSGPDKGNGVADLAMNLLDECISGRMHERVVMPTVRIVEELKSGASALWPTVIRSPEREAFLYHSKPYIVVNPQKFISLARSGFPEVFKQDFLQRSKQSRIAIVRGRGYGPVIDGMIKAIPPERLIEATSYASEFERLYKLLDTGRIAGFFAYEHEVVALCSELGIPEETFSFSRIEGLDFLFACVAGPRTPWGLAAIERINLEIDGIKEQVARRYYLYIDPYGRDEYLAVSRALLEY